MFAALLINRHSIGELCAHLCQFSAGRKLVAFPWLYLNYKQCAAARARSLRHPVELRYDDNVIHMQPEDAVSRCNGCHAASRRARRSFPRFPGGVLELPWNRMPRLPVCRCKPTSLKSGLRLYLQQEICARYDNPPVAPFLRRGYSRFLNPASSATRLTWMPPYPYRSSLALAKQARGEAANRKPLNRRRR